MASKLSLYQTTVAVGQVKDLFQSQLKLRLGLKHVPAPLCLLQETGVNDDLNGTERPVRFEASSLKVEVAQSLAKWKRMALKKYDFPLHDGLYTNMNAIRRDEDLDSTHSIYVDQWDWERVISKEDRTLDYLKGVVKKIVDTISGTSLAIRKKYPQLSMKIDTEVSFITSQELEDLYPQLTPKEREHTYVRDHPTTFILQIGDKLESGSVHDRRAPDYDDWELNGDLLFWSPALGTSLEISSMGIRVDAHSLSSQLKKCDLEDRMKYQYHQMIRDGSLPYTIGGGIGQSRLCMLLLEKAHIGEVQVSVWEKTDGFALL